MLEKIDIAPIIYGKLPEITTVTQMDLCTVFSNVLSNAVSAVKKSTSDKPKILISFEHGAHFFSINVVNSSEQKDVNEPHTRRHLYDRNHGHGIHQIEAIVDKYNGIFEQSAKDGSFTCKIYLPI